MYRELEVGIPIPVDMGSRGKRLNYLTRGLSDMIHGLFGVSARHMRTQMFIGVAAHNDIDGMTAECFASGEILQSAPLLIEHVEDDPADPSKFKACQREGFNANLEMEQLELTTVPWPRALATWIRPIGVDL